MKTMLLILVLASCTNFAQITITSSEVSGWYAVGKTVTTNADTAIVNVNIGSPGGGNNWDFSMFQTITTSNSISVNPAATPYISQFPGANICSYEVSVFGTDSIYSWMYSAIASGFDQIGIMDIFSGDPNLYKSRYFPPMREYPLPLTVDSQWVSESDWVTYTNGVPDPDPLHLKREVVVDAYGTMTLPGGAVYDALRLRLKNTLSFSGLNIITWRFIYMAKNGAQVSFNSVNNNPPSSGTIPVRSATVVPAIISSVEQISELPQDYTLCQNYPNPFNPTTKIRVSIPESEFVTLKVYDVLGKEVAELINEQLSVGTYEVDFNASELTSGVYFYRLQTGSFVETRKMTLLR